MKVNYLQYNTDYTSFIGSIKKNGSIDCEVIRDANGSTLSIYRCDKKILRFSIEAVNYKNHHFLNGDRIICDDIYEMVNTKDLLVIGYSLSDWDSNKDRVNTLYFTTVFDKKNNKIEVDENYMDEYATSLKDSSKNIKLFRPYDNSEAGVTYSSLWYNHYVTVGDSSRCLRIKKEQLSPRSTYTDDGCKLSIGIYGTDSADGKSIVCMSYADADEDTDADYFIITNMTQTDIIKISDIMTNGSNPSVVLDYDVMKIDDVNIKGTVYRYEK